MARPEPRAPAGPLADFRIARDIPLGRHPLLAAFPGLDSLSTARRQEPDPKKRTKLLDETCVMIVADDLWMYVAPWDVPPSARRRWKPVTSPGSDCIVIGEKHLRESEPLILFLDIFHELCHIQQRQRGLELFRGDVSYVDRETEIEAYCFVIEEARQMRISDEILRDYLRVEWISDEEFGRLLRSTGVPEVLAEAAAESARTERPPEAKSEPRNRKRSRVVHRSSSGSASSSTRD
jgi:hypothetical protein